MGAPLVEGLIFVHNALIGFGLRDRLKVIASGKVTSGFEMVKRLALGADLCNSARGMMLALGCIQALKCNTNRCPVGVTSQDPQLVRGLLPDDKASKVANFHHELLGSVGELMGAMGIEHPDDLKPWHLLRRTGPNEVKHYGEIYDFLAPGELLRDPAPPSFARALLAASADTFHHTPQGGATGAAQAS
jgi:glutamate synthase domain-containing protein 2